MKNLIVGLGNIGDEYAETRHNIGFKVLDAFAKASNISFEDSRYGAKAEYKFKGRKFILIKPSTYVNLSGKAINYWLQKEKIPVENLLVIVDDIALPFGKHRLKAKGGDAGHNGLNNIAQILGHNKYARLRIGIGNEYSKGAQINYVLGNWTDNELKILPERIELAVEVIKSFGTVGINFTMNTYNNK
ncbi:MAG: aminoacyl-tRNA hydrolase [Bacteroidota bacterium]|nr:aminoacyl-tRNA hydrolase [Bacteroidota bacterium]